MLQFDLMPFLARAVYSGTTLYMLLILLRWLAPYVHVDLDAPRTRWLRRLADPPVHMARRVLPFMGPFDFAPLAAVFVLWILREIVVGMLLAAARL